MRIYQVAFAVDGEIFQAKAQVPDEQIEALTREIEAKSAKLTRHESPVVGVSCSIVGQPRAGGFVSWLNDVSEGVYGESLSEAQGRTNALVRFLDRAMSLDQQIGEPGVSQELVVQWVWDANDAWAEQRWAVPDEALKDAKNLVTGVLNTLDRKGRLQDALNDLARQMTEEGQGDHPWAAVLRTGFDASIHERREERATHTTTPSSSSRKRPTLRS